MIDRSVCQWSAIDVEFGLRKSCFEDVVGDGFVFEWDCEALFDCVDETLPSATEPWKVRWDEFPAEDNLAGDGCSESSGCFLSLIMEDVVGFDQVIVDVGSQCFVGSSTNYETADGR